MDNVFRCDIYSKKTTTAIICIIMIFALSNCRKREDISIAKNKTYPSDFQSWNINILKESVAEITVDMKEKTAHGFGVVISEDGYILTVTHGVEMANPSREREYVSANTYIQETDTKHVLAAGTKLHMSIKLCGIVYNDVYFVKSFDLDLTIVKINTNKTLKFVEFGKQDNDNRIVVLGRNESFETVPSFGNITDTKGDLWVASVPGVAGDSGAPIFSRNGLCLGVSSYFSYDGNDTNNISSSTMFIPAAKHFGRRFVAKEVTRQ